MIKIKLPQILVALGLSLSISSAYAHTAWIGHVHGEDVVLYGHGGNNSDAYSPSKITNVKGFKLGNPLDVTVNNKENYVTVSSDNAGIISVTLNNGYWCNVEGSGWVNKPKTEVSGKIDYSGLSYKFTTAYMNNREKPVTVGTQLEIVPQVNPATLSKGDKLTVQVLFEGKPLAGAEVTADYFEDAYNRVKTDDKGNVTLVIPNSAFNIIEVGHDAKLQNDPGADEVTLSASLTFVAKKPAKK